MGRVELRNNYTRIRGNLPNGDGSERRFQYELLEGMEHFRVDSENGDVFTLETLDMEHVRGEPE